MGVKPLFYTFVNQILVFASEIKTLLTYPLVKPIIDEHSIHQIAYLGPGRISGNGVFKNIYDFQSKEEMKMHLKDATQKVKKMGVPLLSNDLTAEILARGIFNEAMKPNTSADKLEKMNLLLNEFGLNIKFDMLPVTKAPDMSIASAQQQSKIDRDAFEEDKRTPLSKKQEADFKKKLQELGIDEPDSVSVHHFWALKYNGFVDKKLNQSDNYVRTARQHPWNMDGHDMTHIFDTAGEFLVVDENQKLRLMDFNSLRKAFNSGSKLMLQVPILQVKNDQREFMDLLAISRKEGGCGMYISSDKTPNNYISLPEYCLTSRDGNFNSSFSR